MHQAAWSDPSAGLADGNVGAALVRLPFPGQDNVRAELLFSEPRCVAMPASHPMAATQEPIALRDLLDEPVVAAPRDQAHAVTVAPLDLMEPVRAGGNAGGLGGEAELKGPRHLWSPSAQDF